MKRLLRNGLGLLLALALVGVAGAVTLPASQTESSTTTKTTKSKTSSKTSSKIDINSASQQELESLPGIGPATSAKIVQGRPYRAKSDLVKKKILSKSEYDKIKDNIVAHQPKK